MFSTRPGRCSSLSLQQAKKGLLTLTVRTRLTAPNALGGPLSPPLSRSLSSSTCVAKDGSAFLLESPSAPASTANYRIMLEVSLEKGRGAMFQKVLPGSAILPPPHSHLGLPPLRLPDFPRLESVQKQGRPLSVNRFYS